MKRIKNVLRNALSSSDSSRPASPPAPSDPVITVAHIYAASPSSGTLMEYPEAPVSLVPQLFTGGNLRYTTNSSTTYRASLASLVRAAKMTLLFAEASSPSWNLSQLANRVVDEADNVVECRLLPLLNVQAAAMATEAGWLDMDTERFMRKLRSSYDNWGANLALLVRWKSGRRQGETLPSLPTDADEGELNVDPRRITIWPGPSAPRYGR